MISVLGVVFLNVMATTSVMGAEDGTVEDVAGDKHSAHVNAGESTQFRFRNRFQFQLRTNASTDVEFDCDAAGVGSRNFELELNTTDGQQLSVKVMPEDAALEAKDGQKIQTKTQNKYQYKEQFMVQLQLNGSEPDAAKLKLETNDKSATWAYYNEETGEWCEVDSTYEDGMVVAEVDHFSTWTVLSSTDNTAIITISIVAIVGALGLLALAMKKKKNK